MIKSELVTRIALANPHMFQREVELAVNTVLETMADGLKDDNRIEIRGFGSFSLRRRKARLGRNPRTGSPVDVAEKAAPFFRVGKELRDRINGLRPTRRRKGARADAEDSLLPAAE